MESSSPSSSEIRIADEWNRNPPPLQATGDYGLERVRVDWVPEGEIWRAPKWDEATARFMAATATRNGFYVIVRDMAADFSTRLHYAARLGSWEQLDAAQLYFQVPDSQLGFASEVDDYTMSQVGRRKWWTLEATSNKNGFPHIWREADGRERRVQKSYSRQIERVTAGGEKLRVLRFSDWLVGSYATRCVEGAGNYWGVPCNHGEVADYQAHLESEHADDGRRVCTGPNHYLDCEKLLLVLVAIARDDPAFEVHDHRLPPWWFWVKAGIAALIVAYVVYVILAFITPTPGEVSEIYIDQVAEELKELRKARNDGTTN